MERKHLFCDCWTARRAGLTSALLIVGICVLAPPARFAVQARGQIMMKRGFMVPLGTPAADEEPAKEDSLAGGATLENDPEIERILFRAGQAVGDQRFDLATSLLQKVLDTPTGFLVERGVRTVGDRKFEFFGSVRDEAEQLIAKMPSEGLHVYRLTADGEARGLLATPPGPEREAALAEVVRRFYMSSLGDDAAFELGCQLLDRCDFVGASQLFNKILAKPGDSSVNRQAVQLRLAVANANLGDVKRATRIMESLEQTAGSRLPPGLLDAVKQDVLGPHSLAVAVMESGSSWLMPMGTPSRDGQMPVIPSQLFKKTLGEAWNSPIELPSSPLHPVQNGRHRFVMGGIQPAAEDVSPKTLITHWLKPENHLIPSGNVLVEKGHIYFKTAHSVICYDAATGAVCFETHRAPEDASGTVANMQQLRQMGVNLQGRAQLNSYVESVAFGDRAAKCMSILDGVLYQVEGAPEEKESTDPQQQMFINGMQRVAPRRNRLAAYQTKAARPSAGTGTSGKELWNRGGDVDKDGEAIDVRFMAAPSPCAGQLIVPAREGGALWLYALAPKTGATLWKVFLCDEARGGTVPDSPVGLAVEGENVYVASGAGVVFAVDGNSGSIHWATRYQRSEARATNQQQWGWAAPMMSGMSLHGWDEDAIIAHGRVLLILPTDAEMLLALDRRTGEVLWHSPQDSARYCLGLMDDAVFVGGADFVRRYNIAGGKLVWDKRLDGPSLGRGCVTSEALYLPVKDSIMKIDLYGGKALAQVGVEISEQVSDKESYPVGNLYSNGERVFVVGADRISALDVLKPKPQPAPADSPAGKAEKTEEKVQAKPAEADGKGQSDNLDQSNNLKPTIVIQVLTK